MKTSFAFALSLLSACSLLQACGNTGAPPEDYGPLLVELTEQVILPEHANFGTQADALERATQALVDAPSEITLRSAQESWRAARKAYRMLDALAFGPSYTMRLSDRIDASPVDAPGIEALATNSEPINDAAIAATGGRKKGFLALEYLLFAEPDAASPAPVLADDDLSSKRRAWALAMAREIASSARDLDDAWQPSLGGFATVLEHAGQASSPYRTQRAAVNDLSGGVGATLERVVRYGLREPLGKSSGGVPAPELVLTFRSDSAVADMQASLAGVSALYERGFSTVIRGKSLELDTTVLAELAASEQKLADIPAPFAEALIESTAVVDAAYDATRTLKALWSTEVSSALGATVQFNDPDGD